MRWVSSRSVGERSHAISRHRIPTHRSALRFPPALGFLVCLGFLLASLPASAREKDAIQYGAGLIVNVPLPEAEVLQVVKDVAENGIIRGSKEYSKDEYINGATQVSSTEVFPENAEPGKVFYKVKLKALDPQNFKDTNDVGTLAVRYIVQGQDDKHTVLRINAVFAEEYRHVSHPSNGSVEGAEYQTIHDHLDSLELMKSGTVEAEKAKDQMTQRQAGLLTDESSSSVAHPSVVATPVPDSAPAEAVKSAPETSTPPPSKPQTLEERVQDLRHQVERLVKAPGAPLKSAPFHTASTLQRLPPGEQVLVEISTPYWLGVETHAGQHGWMQRDELELIP